MHEITDEILTIISPLIDKGLKMGADEIELFAQRTRSKEVNMDTNILKSASAGIIEGVGIRVLVNRALGFASINSLNQDKIETGIRSAIELASVTPPMEYYQLSTSKKIHKVSGLFDSQVESISIEDTIEYGKTILSSVQDYDSRATVMTASVSVNTIENAIVTSSDIEASEKRSRIDWIIVGWAKDGDDVSSFDFEFSAAVKVADVDIASTAKIFAERAVKTLGAKKVETFDGQAIFSPDIFSALFSIIVQSASASQIQADSSYLKDRLGEEIAVQDLTVIDDGTTDGRVGSGSFDREGVPHRDLTIIENGVFKEILYDTFTANKAELESTGHTVGSFRNSPSISSTNLTIEPGTHGLDEIIAEVDHGVLIQGVDAFPDPVSGDFSGPIKGGHLIKKGEIVGPLTEITITTNLFECLKKISAISKERKLIGYEGQSWYFPFVRVDGLQFVS